MIEYCTSRTGFIQERGKIGEREERQTGWQ